MAIGLALLIASSVAGFIVLVLLCIVSFSFGIENDKINKIIINVIMLGIPLAAGILTFIKAYRYLAKIFESHDELK